MPPGALFKTCPSSLKDCCAPSGVLSSWEQSRARHHQPGPGLFPPALGQLPLLPLPDGYPHCYEGHSADRAPGAGSSYSCIQRQKGDISPLLPHSKRLQEISSHISVAKIWSWTQALAAPGTSNLSLGGPGSTSRRGVAD